MAGDDSQGPVVVLSHGWGDSRVGSLSRASALLPLASRIVMWDMPGHGEAPGTCSLGAREPDALLALLARIAPCEPVVLFGWSLGAGVSIATASRLADAPLPGVSLAGVIAEAPYRLARTPARNVLVNFGMPHRLNLPLALACIGIDARIGPRWQGFDRAALAARLRAPLLVIHGVLDDVSPVEDGRAIAAAAPEGTIVELPEAGHHGIWTTPLHATRATDAVRAWIAAASAR
jgi:pimeloyl-ACP methyl ester carboxylesterase